MQPKHSREEARSAKRAAATRFRDDTDVTSVGIGLTEDLSDFAVTITVAKASALKRIPKRIGTVPVRKTVDGEATALASASATP